MPVLPQADVAQFAFELSSLAPDTFDVLDFHGEEQVSDLFRFDINLASRDPDVDFAAVLNQPAVLTIRYGLEEVPIHGIVADFEQSGRTKDWFGYRAVLVPRFWWLTLIQQSRVFQNQSADEIIRDVLMNAGLASGKDYRFELQSGCPPREYCVQFNETDFNFVSRLLEFEGIHYFFVHEDRDVLVITDNRGSAPSVRGDAVLPYNPGGGLAADAETVREFVAREQVVTGKHVVRDYHYETPTMFVSAESQINDSLPGMRYEYGDGILDQSTGSQLIRVRNEEIESTRKRMFGESDCNRIAHGHTFSLEGHYRSSLDGLYYITAVRHVGTQKMALAGLSGKSNDGRAPGETETYRNTFTCIPGDAPFRPPRRSTIPKIHGVISAKVESAGGEYAYIDDSGRYHVKMPFDVGDQGSGTASLPIPATQINAGPDYGVHFPIHENNDVVLAFIDGNVDRPYILGALPTPANISPVTAANKAQNVIRTMSGHEVVLDDTNGHTQIKIQSADGHVLLFDDGDDRVVLTTTEQHQFLFDDKNKRINVSTKNGHFMLMDDGNEKITIQSKDGHRVSINDADKLITMVDESGDHLFQIDIGNEQLTIKTASGGIDLQAPAGLIEIKANELKIETTGDTNIKANNISAEAMADYKVKAMNIHTSASVEHTQKGMNITSEAMVEHKIKGVNVKSEGAAQNSVEGTAVNVKASAIAIIQGALVKIN